MNAQELHEQGMQLREQGNFAEATQALSRAIFQAAADENFMVLAGAHGDLALVWKHLFMLTNLATYLDLMGHDIDLMHDFSQKGEIMALETKSLFLKGEQAMLMKKYDDAARWYSAAIDQAPLDAEKGDFTYHLGEALYRSGKKSEGKAAFEKGLDILMQFESATDSFNFHVWLSGGYMRLAELLRVDEPDVAKEYLNKAKDIIDGDERLVIRNRQWQMLEKLFT